MPDKNEAVETAKGHATRSRKQAEAERKASLKPARGSKEAKKVARQRDYDQRNLARIAMYTNDEKHLPLKDKGPVKRFTRNYLDSRVTMSELLMPFTLIILGISLFQNPSLYSIVVALWYGLLVAMVVDSFIIVRRLKKLIAAKYPGESTRGLATYIIMRTLTLRQLRLPRPMVKVGGAPKPVKIPKTLR